MNYTPFLQVEMTEAALAFGKNLVDSEAYVRYRKAEQAYKSDPPAYTLQNKLNLAQANVLRNEKNGSITPDDLQVLGDLQGQVQENPILMEYITAQQEMTKFFQEINNEISQLLGINFALIARHTSCC